MRLMRALETNEFRAIGRPRFQNERVCGATWDSVHCAGAFIPRWIETDVSREYAGACGNTAGNNADSEVHFAIVERSR